MLWGCLLATLGTAAHTMHFLCLDFSGLLAEALGNLRLRVHKITFWINNKQSLAQTDPRYKKLIQLTYQK